MSIKWVNGDVETILPDKAEELIAQVVPERQRPIKGNHVLHLALMMEQGQFLTGHVAIASVRGQRCIANGQHTLRAIIKSGRPTRCLVEEYLCDSDADYRMLFSCYDTENRQRSNNDVAQNFLMTGCVSTPEVSPSLLSLIKSAVDFASQQGHLKTRKMVTKFDKFSEATAFSSQIDFIKHLDEKKEMKTLLYRASTVAAIISTHSRWPVESRDFWTQVVSGFFAVPDKSHPAVKLNRWLKEHTQNNTGGAFRSSTVLDGESKFVKNASQNDVFMACMRCWNAYARGEMLSKVYVTRKGDDLEFAAPTPSRSEQCKLATA